MLSSMSVSAISYIMDMTTMDCLNEASVRVCTEMEIDSFNIALEVQTDGLEGSSGKVCCVFNASAYDALSKKHKKEYINELMYKITREEPMNAAQTQQAYNFLVGVDDSLINTAVQDLLDNSNGNMLQAVVIMSPVLNVVNTIFGILIIVTLVVTVFVTVLDIAYIGTPFLQSMGKDDKKPKFITNDAYRAVMNAADSGENPHWCYLKKRFIVFIIIVICVSIIITGKLGDFVSTIVGFFM